MKPKGDSGLLYPQEVAVLFRVHQATVSRWVLQGKFDDDPNDPIVIRTPSGRVRFKERKILALLRSMGVAVG